MYQCTCSLNLPASGAVKSLHVLCTSQNENVYNAQSTLRKSMFTCIEEYKMGALLMHVKLEDATIFYLLLQTVRSLKQLTMTLYGTCTGMFSIPFFNWMSYSIFNSLCQSRRSHHIIIHVHALYDVRFMPGLGNSGNHVLWEEGWQNN